MPYINLPKKTKENKRNENTPMRELRKKAYNTTAWRNLREAYMKQNPLCEECLKKGKVTPASSVHHIKSPFKGGELNKVLFLDYNNLQSICHECHAEIHNKEQGHISPQEILKQLEMLMDDNIPDEYFDEQ